LQIAYKRSNNQRHSGVIYKLYNRDNIIIAKWCVQISTHKLIHFITPHTECRSDASCLHIPADKEESIEWKDEVIIIAQ